MAINKVGSKGIEDGSVAAVDFAPGTVTDVKLNATQNLSSKTITLPNTSVTNGMLAGSIANAKLSNSSITASGTAVALGASITLNNEFVEWQSVITGNTTMVAGRGYFVNTTGGAISMTLPASASIGDFVAIKDYAGTFATNKLTILRNGHNIQGVANESLISTNRASVVLVYVDSTKGWLFTHEHNVADLQAPLFTQATGGTITTSGDFKIHSFTGDGNFVVSQVGNPAGGPSNVDYLVVAGGGSGGQKCGGGAGAGGYRTSFPSPGCNAGAFPITATTYPITVGGGGASRSGTQPVPARVGLQGNNSVFSTITSNGGGGGNSEDSGLASSASPIAGASGGGSAGPNNPGNNAGAGNTPPVSPPQGNNGGGGGSGCGGYNRAGGGGGATAVGGDGSASSGGTGGAGAPNTILGSDTSYAGGGGGGMYDTGPTVGGNGGAGGGGPAGRAPNASGPDGSGNPGTVNTGGGGGGSAQASGLAYTATPSGAGGKGIVIIRYKFQ
jgi:hypothetical protein